MNTLGFKIPQLRVSFFLSSAFHFAVSGSSSFAFLVFIFAILNFSSCSKETPNNPHANIPPETYLALFPDGELHRSTSRQHIHWWGDDPDGFVSGFLISLDSVKWTFTIRNDSVLSLPIFGRDTTYSFYVRALDDQGNKKYDAAGPYGAEPYTDLNNNNQHDPGEPFIDFGIADPTPASLKYPIQNSPPKVEFIKGTEVPETTFTVATFSWIGTDLDGDGSISKYQYALNDTNATNWKDIPRNQTLLTLVEKDGLAAGNNIFYLRAVDIAEAMSNVIRMPDTSKVWIVRKPQSELLIVDDYGVNDGTAQFYNAIFDTLLNGRLKNPEVLDIKRGSTSTKKGVLVPPFINPTFIETLKLFKYIVWYADNNPTLDIAQLSLKAFTDAGGKIIYTASFPESAIDPRGGIVDFAPVDSLSPTPITFIPANTRAIADASDYSELRRDTKGVPVAFIRGLFRKINAVDLYHFESSAFWSGTPTVAVRSGDKNFFLFSIPLHRFDGNMNVGFLLRKIFADEFGLR